MLLPLWEAVGNVLVSGSLTRMSILDPSVLATFRVKNGRFRLSDTWIDYETIDPVISLGGKSFRMAH